MLKVANCEKEPNKKTNNPDPGPNAKLLLEITLHSINLDIILATYERLSSYILLSPYNESAILIGYAGLMAKMLSTNAPDSNSRTIYRTFALEHLSESLRILPETSLFISLYLEVFNFLIFVVAWVS
jgi:hypothetical protein